MGLFRSGGRLLKHNAGMRSCCCNTPPPPPPPPPPCVGACCVSNECSLQTEQECINLGGRWVRCGAGCDDIDACPPDCEDIGCSFDRWETAVVTISITTFDTQVGTTNDPDACNSFIAGWTAKVQEINGTYTLSKVYPGRLEFRAGTQGTSGYIFAFIDSVPADTSIYGNCELQLTCPIVLQLSLGKNNMDYGSSYISGYVQGGLYRECQIPFLGNSGIAASEAGASACVNACDGQFTFPVGGVFAPGGFCRSGIDCTDTWGYSGTATITMI